MTAVRVVGLGTTAHAGMIDRVVMVIAVRVAGLGTAGPSAVAMIVARVVGRVTIGSVGMGIAVGMIVLVGTTAARVATTVPVRTTAARAVGPGMTGPSVVGTTAARVATTVRVAMGMIAGRVVGLVMIGRVVMVIAVATTVSDRTGIAVRVVGRGMNGMVVTTVVRVATTVLVRTGTVVRVDGPGMNGTVGTIADRAAGLATTGSVAMTVRTGIASATSGAATTMASAGSPNLRVQDWNRLQTNPKPHKISI